MQLYWSPYATKQYSIAKIYLIHKSIIYIVIIKISAAVALVTGIVVHVSLLLYLLFILMFT